MAVKALSNTLASKDFESNLNIAKKAIDEWVESGDETNYVDAFVNAVEGARKTRGGPKVASADEAAFARGGYGKLFKTAISIPTILSESSDEFTIPDTLDVVNKVVKASGRIQGTEILTEMAMLKAVQSAIANGKCLGGVADQPSFLMPAARVDIDSRNSSATLALPSGLCDASAIVRTGAKLPEQTLRRWSSELICAVTEMHLNGVVHGDIKPSNMIVFPCTIPGSEDDCELRKIFATAMPIAASKVESEERERARKVVALASVLTTVRLSDFGLSSYVANHETGVVERSSSYAYTAFYRAPEVWEGGVWSYAAEVWAIGCTLFELAFGGTLFMERRDGKNTNMRKVAFLNAISAFSQDFDLLGDTTIVTESCPPKRTGEGIFVYDTIRHVLKKSGEDFDLIGGLPFSREESISFRRLMGACLQPVACMRLWSLDLIEHPFFATKSTKRIETFKTEVLTNTRIAYPTIDFSGFKNLVSEDFERIYSIIADDIFKKEDSGKIVSHLATWLALRALAAAPKSSSIRMRRMKEFPIVAICASVASKILGRKAASEEAEAALESFSVRFPAFDERCTSYSQPSAARDERAICQSVNFILFPFGEPQVLRLR